MGWSWAFAIQRLHIRALGPLTHGTDVRKKRPLIGSDCNAVYDRKREEKGAVRLSSRLRLPHEWDLQA